MEILPVSASLVKDDDTSQCRKMQGSKLGTLLGSLLLPGSFPGLLLLLLLQLLCCRNGCPIRCCLSPTSSTVQHILIVMPGTYSGQVSCCHSSPMVH